MRHHLLLGRLVVAALAAALALVTSGSPSQAGNPHGGGGGSTTTATAQASASVSGTTASLQAKVNRTASEVAALTCSVAGAGTTQNASCRLVSSSRKAGASYAGTVSGLAAGTYTFTARFTLTNGTSAQASAAFSVASGTAPSGPQSTCVSYGGTYTTNASGWDCDAPAAAYSALDQACTGVSVWTFYTKNRASWVSFSCSGMRG